ncbi:hypothetical protein EXT42_16935 [Pseudoalteromonas sp. CO302Y]|nr:hypothetical protein EXT42_16935 [Pseudoalteromonas sp. CO302Y]RZG06560.1 hypothetical protein EXT40_16940 [Pseudoalteromonas sp. CO133X]
MKPVATCVKISHLEQLNNEIFVLLTTRFPCLKIDYLIKRMGITSLIVFERSSKIKAFGL